MARGYICAFWTPIWKILNNIPVFTLNLDLLPLCQENLVVPHEVQTMKLDMILCSAKFQSPLGLPKFVMCYE